MSMNIELQKLQQQLLEVEGELRHARQRCIEAEATATAARRSAMDAWQFARTMLAARRERQ
jgi:hypothetical protein